MVVGLKRIYSCERNVVFYSLVRDYKVAKRFDESDRRLLLWLRFVVVLLGGKRFESCLLLWFNWLGFCRR